VLFGPYVHPGCVFAFASLRFDALVGSLSESILSTVAIAAAMSPPFALNSTLTACP
jgi:hypothetical protein